MGENREPRGLQDRHTRPRRRQNEPEWMSESITKSDVIELRGFDGSAEAGKEKVPSPPTATSTTLPISLSLGLSPRGRKKDQLALSWDRARSLPVDGGCLHSRCRHNRCFLLISRALCLTTILFSTSRTILWGLSVTPCLVKLMPWHNIKWPQPTLWRKEWTLGM